MAPAVVFLFLAAEHPEAPVASNDPVTGEAPQRASTVYVDPVFAEQNKRLPAEETVPSLTHPTCSFW